MKDIALGGKISLNKFVELRPVSLDYSNELHDYAIHNSARKKRRE